MLEKQPNEHARALAEMGASKGGVARAQRLTQEQRREIARQAALTRWQRGSGADEDSQIPQAAYGSSDHPLKLGGVEIPCYVVEQEDGPLRLIVHGGMMKALNMTSGSTGGRGSGSRLSRFVASKSIKPFITPALEEKISSPILFRTPLGNMAYGFEASVLADICDAVLESRATGHLNRQQEHIAVQCEILVRGWARVGLSALIDEATGYQYYRSRHALEEILDQFIAKELRAWAKTFPDEFYQELFRLRGWSYVPFNVKRPQAVGNFTNDIVYSRLGPGVLGELQRITPKDSKGRRIRKYHQRLSETVGHPKLREHLAASIALMKVSRTWNQFYRMLQTALPKYNVNLPLPMENDQIAADDQNCQPQS